jgi:hypothetical protein
VSAASESEPSAVATAGEAPVCEACQ